MPAWLASWLLDTHLLSVSSHGPASLASFLTRALIPSWGPHLPDPNHVPDAPLSDTIPWGVGPWRRPWGAHSCSPWQCCAHVLPALAAARARPLMVCCPRAATQDFSACFPYYFPAREPVLYVYWPFICVMCPFRSFA